jgi:putative SOS response-associated peptidase YedK
MCSRFALKSTPKAIADLFKLEKAVEWKPRYNVTPSQLIPAVIHPLENRKREMKLLNWGFVASWMQGGRLLVNAQSEHIQEKPILRESFEKWRCLIPVDGFYEWRHEARETKPYFIRMKRDRPFALAGLWAPQEFDGKKVDSGVILTTKPNETVRAIHERMPVIVDEKDFKLWLDSDIHDFEQLERLFEPYPAKEMEAFEVSYWVNDTFHDDPRCIEPFQEPGTLPLPFPK